jgi:hypothetical protein
MNAAHETARALLACTLSVAALTVGAGTASADPTVDGPACQTGARIPVVPGGSGQLDVEGFPIAVWIPIRILDARDNVIGQTNFDGPVTVTWPAWWGPNDGVPFHLVVASQLGAPTSPGCVVENLAPGHVPNT